MQRAGDGDCQPAENKVSTRDWMVMLMVIMMMTRMVMVMLMMMVMMMVMATIGEKRAVKW